MKIEPELKIAFFCFVGEYNEGSKSERKINVRQRRQEKI